MTLLKLAVSKIYQNQRAWKDQRVSRNPHSRGFHGILRESRQRVI